MKKKLKIQRSTGFAKKLVPRRIHPAAKPVKESTMGEANRAQRRTAISALTKEPEARPSYREPRVRAPDVILNPTTPVHLISDRRSTPGQLAHAGHDALEDICLRLRFQVELTFWGSGQPHGWLTWEQNIRFFALNVFTLIYFNDKNCSWCKWSKTCT